jgi:hypothetical protein
MEEGSTLSRGREGKGAGMKVFCLFLEGTNMVVEI